jgi:cell division protease FtsH
MPQGDQGRLTVRLWGGNEEREQTLNQLHSEMDGFDPNTGVILLAAKNCTQLISVGLTLLSSFISD